MKNILFLLFLTGLILSYCSPVKQVSQVSVKQGMAGFITETVGNQMPMKGAAPAQPKGIATTVYFYEPTQIAQTIRNEANSSYYTMIKTHLVASAETDSTGSFSVSLPPGKYSVFIKQGRFFYANLFDTQNNIALFTVEADQLTKINLTVNSTATY